MGCTSPLRPFGHTYGCDLIYRVNGWYKNLGRNKGILVFQQKTLKLAIVKVTLVWAIKDKEEPLLTILKLNKSLAFDLIHFILRLYNLRVAFVIYGKTFMNQPLTFSEPYKMSTDVIHCRDYNPIGCIIRDTVFEDEYRPITK